VKRKASAKNGPNQGGREKKLRDHLSHLQEKTVVVRGDTCGKRKIGGSPKKPIFLGKGKKAPEKGEKEKGKVVGPPPYSPCLWPALEQTKKRRVGRHLSLKKKE